MMSLESSAMTPAGLRERKKQRTREAIVEAALRLFDERGFDQTTIADIAEAADIAPRTFFGYFPSKEDVVFADSAEFFDEFSQRVVHHDEGETAIDALRAWFTDHIDELLQSDERNLCRRRVIAGSDALAAHERAISGRFQDVLAEAVARDLGDSAEDLRPRLVAAAAIAALESLVHQDIKGKKGTSSKQALAVIDQAMDFLQGGLAALRKQVA
jgi:AcrR family transcriptional regulator